MKRIYLEWKTLYQQFDRILLLFATAFAALELVWVPINSWLSEVLLALTGHAYLSPTNLLEVLAGKWWVALLFVLLVLANLVLVYLEIGLIVVGLTRILRREESLKLFLMYMLGEMRRLLVQMSVTRLLYVLTYSAVIFPFLRKILRIYYVDKLVIPQFIIDYLVKNYFLAVIMLVALLFFFWLAARLIFSLPLIYQGEKTVGEAVQISLQKTKALGIWKTYFRLLWLVVQTVLAFVVIGYSIYYLQVLVDKLPDALAFGFAMLHMILLYLFYYGTISLFLLKFISFSTESDLLMPNQKKVRHVMRLGILLLASLYFGVQAYISLYFPFETLPVTISHRGVDMQNGVQNTIDSLKKTAKLKPDYIEMDVQETKDGLFVVMHDTDLMVLTGFEGGTHDYSLEELSQMEASENGQTSPVATFEEYLTVAEELGQKLIVEIKTTEEDSPQMVKNFLETYGKRLIKGGHQMQSLDYKTIIEIKQFDKELLSAFILPFNSIYPTTMADGYTMEYTSLDQAFILKSWIQKKFVYAWTPNDEDSMRQMIQLQVDGIITDNLQELQTTMKEFSDHQSYADLVLLQVRLFFLQF